MEKGKVVRDNGPGVSVLNYKEFKRNSTECDKYISLCPPLQRNPTAMFGEPNQFLPILHHRKGSLLVKMLEWDTGNWGFNSDSNLQISFVVLTRQLRSDI